MIEQFPGRYSWNRVSPLLNPAWMREWPESFLLPDVVATGVLPSKARDGALGSPLRMCVRRGPLDRPPCHLREPAGGGLVPGRRRTETARAWPGGARRHGTTQRDRQLRDLGDRGGAAYSIEQRGQPERVACDKARLPGVAQATDRPGVCAGTPQLRLVGRVGLRQGGTGAAARRCSGCHQRSPAPGAGHRRLGVSRRRNAGDQRRGPDDRSHRRPDASRRSTSLAGLRPRWRPS